MDRREPHLTARAVRPLVSGLRVLGHDPTPLLAAAELSAEALADPDAPIPMRRVHVLIQRAVGATGDDNFGLRMAQHAEPGSFDVHMYALLSSPTLGDGYERLCRFQRMIHESTRVELDRADGEATLRHVMPGGLPAPRHTAEFLLTAWVRAGRLATGHDWAPLEVRFAHPEPDDVRPHRAFFDAPVRFAAGENALALDTSLLAEPCVQADPALLAVLDRYAADRLAAARTATTLADRVRNALGTALTGSRPTATHVARALGMSVRSLGRGLAEEGTTFQALLDTERREVAIRHLRDHRYSIEEIGFLLGYGDLSAFYRAFRRWTGQTPAVFRQSLRSR